jgi:hypothetical protein
MKTILKKCSCPNAFQDAAYGAGIRVHNPMKQLKEGKARCATCGSEANVSKAEEPADKTKTAKTATPKQK